MVFSRITPMPRDPKTVTTQAISSSDAVESKGFVLPLLLGIGVLAFMLWTGSDLLQDSDLFWQIAPGIQLDPDVPEQMQQALDLMPAFDQDAGVRDIEATIRAAGWNGRFLVIGFPSGIPKIPLNLTLLKSCDIVGVFWGAAVARDPKGHAANMAELMQMYAEGKIKPRVSQTFPLEKAGAAIKALGDRQALGKIVVTVES